MKGIKKTLALFLTLVTVILSLSVCFAAFAADGDKCNCGVTPVIYVKGRTNIYKNRFDELNAENMAETNLSGSTEDLISSAANILQSFGIALLTDEWDDYCDVLFEEIAPIYDQYKLNNDGEKGEGNLSGIAPEWDLENIIADYKNKNVRVTHTTSAFDWAQNMQFQYDMRLDPCENAKDLRELIKATMEITGHDKVNIICRCEGNVIVNAYFNMFTQEAKSDVEGVVMFNSIASGSEIADEMYSNKVKIDPDAMNSFINTFLDTSPILDLVKATVNLATFNGLLEDGLGFFEEIYDKISLNLMPRLIREIFGTCPGWWGMVSPEVFEECKAFVLGTDNADGKYNKLIDKIDFYNYNYKVNARGILEELQDSGVKVHVLTKYGSPMYPCIESYDLLGDGVVSLTKQTFNGATTSLSNETLSKNYIQQRVEAGFGEFISADEKVDGSTAAFPLHTWYIKNLRHDSYPWITDEFMLKLLSFDGYADIYSFGDEFTAFMYYEDTEEKKAGMMLGELTPLTQDNKDVNPDTTDTSSVFAVLLKFLTAFFNFIRSLFTK